MHSSLQHILPILNCLFPTPPHLPPPLQYIYFEENIVLMFEIFFLVPPTNVHKNLISEAGIKPYQITVTITWYLFHC